MNGSSKPILVAAFGNPDAGDDALGPMVARRLSQINPPHVETLNLATNLGAMMCALNGRKMLLVVDAALIPDQKPGAVLDFDWYGPNKPNLWHDRTISTHGWSVIDQLSLAATLNLLPQQVRLIVMTIESVELGRTSEELLERGARQIVERVLAWQSHLTTPVGSFPSAEAVFH
jgi:hydrogenase maturation protease